MGKFIVIEGMDGSGKSTQTRLLTNFLESRGLRVKSFHFPSGKGFYGETINRFLRGELGSAEDVDPYFAAFIFAGDRRDMADEVRQWIDEYDIVLMDRYAFSNIVYQCAKVEGREAQKKLRDWMTRLEFEEFGIPKPDASFFLNVPQKFVESQLSGERKGSERDYLEGGTDIHEKSRDLQRRVGEQYRLICRENPDLISVDCAGRNGIMQNSEDIHRMLLGVLRNRGVI